jgi:very-short-patch-repair endonuclease
VTPADVIRMFGGVLEYAVLTVLVSRGDIEAALARGEVVRLRRGVYGLSCEGARAVAVAAGGHVSHLSAALHHGWKVKHVPDRPCITIRRNAARPDVDADLHWGTVWPAEAERGVTRPVRTVIDCARTCPYDEALCVADSALRAGAVTRAQLLDAATASPRTGRSRAIRVVTHADGRADNPFESCVRAVCHTVDGLSVEPQVSIPGIGRVDLADRSLGIVIECDSFEFHSERKALSKDIRRYNEAARRGWVVLRFSWEQAMSDPDYVRAVLRDVVRLRTTEVVRRRS